MNGVSGASPGFSAPQNVGFPFSARCPPTKQTLQEPVAYWFKAFSRLTWDKGEMKVSLELNENYEATVKKFKENLSDLPTIAIDVPKVNNSRPMLRALQAFQRQRVVTFPLTTCKNRFKTLFNCVVPSYI